MPIIPLVSCDNYEALTRANQHIRLVEYANILILYRG